MPHHRIHYPDLAAAPGQEIVVDGEEARHAVRVKRLETGQSVELFDGRGRAAAATVSGARKRPKTHEWQLLLRVMSVHDHPRTSPRLEVWTAVPKGPRLEEMIDQLSQVGASAWAPLAASRSVVDPREGKLNRLSRIAAESAKQCGRPWMLEILEGGTLKEALGVSLVVIADADGDQCVPDHTAADQIRLLVGPEGGWTTEERELALAAGARRCSFGPYAMRIETAAVVGAGIVLEAWKARAR